MPVTFFSLSLQHAAAAFVRFAFPPPVICIKHAAAAAAPGQTWGLSSSVLSYPVKTYGSLVLVIACCKQLWASCNQLID